MTKILLVGEYSNVHWTLAKGLSSLGHHVQVASTGDEWKNLPRQVDLASRNFWLKRYTSINYRLFGSRYYSEQSINLLRHLASTKYDVVQFINPLFLDDSPENLLSLFRKIKKVSGATFLGAYGDDHFFATAALSGKLRYSIFSPLIRNPDLASEYAHPLRYLTKPIERLNKLMADEVDGIVAPVIEYKIPYDAYKNKVRHIPFGIDLQQIELRPNVVTNQQVKFFHGIQKGRETVKGTSFIIETMKLAKEKYGDRLSFDLGSNIPFSSYTNHLYNFNVIVDQLYGYSQGMNTLQAMAQGRVCLAGCEPEFLATMNLSDAPVFNIVEDIDRNLKVVSELMDSTDRIPEIGEAARRHVERFHDYKNVAKMYLDFWTHR